MAFKELNDLNPDTTITLGGTNKKTGKANATQVEGYYLGSRTVADKKKKSGVSYIHVFETAKGTLGVWGKTDMDRKVLAVTPGTMTRVTSTGTRPTPNGDMYVFKVAIDTENTIEVQGNVNNQAPAQEQDADTEDDESNTYAPTPAFDEDEELVISASAEAAAKKARVAALLAKNKKA